MESKNEFCFMMGYYSGRLGLTPCNDNEIEIAWASYSAIPDGASLEQIDEAADKCAHDMAAVRGSVKE